MRRFLKEELPSNQVKIPFMNWLLVIIWKVNPFVASVTFSPISNCIQMIGEFLTATFKYTMRWKIFQCMKFLFWHSSNSRKLSRPKFHNELASVFTAHLYATSKNADWNQQQLTDGSVLVNRNSANRPYCFLSNQKKVQILAFLLVICKRNVSCPLPENRLQR